MQLPTPSPIVSELNRISGEVVDAAVAIHSELGPGLLESVYEVTLAHELRQRGFRIDRQVPVPIEYRGIRFDEGYRLDIVVNDLVIVEVKSIEGVSPVHKKQLLTYLRLTRRPLGLLLNFNVNLMKEGISRVANGIEDKQ
jgi:GxxExxY protein